MDIGSSPSIVGLSQSVANDLRVGKIVYFHFPPINQATAWEEEIVNAICDRAASTAPSVHELDASDAAPESSLRSQLDVDAGNLADALQSYAYACSPIVVTVHFNAPPSESWTRLFGKLERLYESGAEEGGLRGLMIVCHGGQSVGTSGKASPAVKHLHLWNALRWEDMRCLAIGWLESEDNNPLMRSWQVSTYTGAANGDPFLLREICDAAPRFLSDIRRNFLLARKNAGGCCAPASMELPRAEARWLVPASCMSSWAKGELVGMTLDRGPQIPWESIAPSAMETYEERLIWQEQITSLLPMLLEFTRQAASWISRYVTPDWEQYLADNSDEFGAVEPGRILYIFRKYGLGRLPDSLYRLLEDLRNARNDLAHMTPLDSNSVASLWSTYCTAQEKYGKVSKL